MRRSPKTTAEPVLSKELRRSAPRPVTLTGFGVAAVAVTIALGLGALIAGIWLFARAEGDSELARRIRSEGVSTQARVTQIERRRGENAKVVASYSYFSGGLAYGGKATLRKRDRDRYRTGSTLAVRYLPSNPSESWIDGYEPRGLPHWLVFAVSSSLLLCAVLLLIWLRRQYELLERGRLALARVTDIAKQKGRDQATWRVDYEWHLLSGARRTGKYETVKKPPAIGEFVTIIYDRNQPLRNAVYPFSLVRTHR